jgi:foldase protein PrsA
VLAAVLCLAACGSGGSDVIVARVGGHSITKGTLDRWTAIEGVLSYQANPTQPVPKGVVPDPPSYSNCVTYLRTTPTTLIAAAGKPTMAQLKAQCRLKHETLQRHMLDILITNYWLQGEGARRGLTIGEAEVQRALHSQFPTQAAFRRFLAITGESAPDERALLRANLMATRLQQEVVAQKGASGVAQQRALAGFLREFTARWTARTSCSAGYVVQECPQFNGPRAPAGL